MDVVICGDCVRRHVDACKKIMEALKLTVNNETYYLLSICCVSGVVLLYIHYHLVCTLLCEGGTVSFILHRRKLRLREVVE